MPTLDALDYERFSYDESSVQPLHLDEAMKKATELRKADHANFYRVQATDASATAFRVEQVPVASVYAEFVSRFAQRFLRHSLSKRS